MRYGSVCSGIEAASVAWHSVGWEPVFFSEIEPFPCAVLKHHYPAVPNYGDMTKFKEWPDESIDVLVGGTPCQSFSVAGLRAGLADPRGNLMLTYLAIADRYRPEWLVWENVPGVLSSNGGRDFGTFLQGVGELGYGFAYRILDAQYFGVAQRRRRVFVVANARGWQRAAAVLFERESLCGNPAPSREKGQEVAGTIAARFGISRNNHEECVPTVAETLIASDHKGPGHNRDHNFIAHPITFGAQMSVPQTDVDMVQTLQAKNPMAVMQPVALGTDCYNGAITGEVAATIGTPGSSVNASGPTVMQPVAMRESGQGFWMQDEIAGTLRAEGENRPSRPSNVIAQPVAPALTASNDPSRSPQSSEVTQQVTAVHSVTMQVRRLTPVECERLQGFPDNYTNIPWRKKDESPDGPRYKALGNSMAVPVMNWIGQRIQKVSEL